MPRAAETASERQARLAEIRRQIQSGEYETRARLSAAIDAILEDFEGQNDGSGEQSFSDHEDSPR